MRCALLLAAALAAHAQPVTVILVRHAERAAAPAQDPPLTPAGSARARLLAGMLRDAGVIAVYASEFRRTAETVQPTADRFRLPVTQVKAGDPAALSRRVLAHKDGTVLVAGHSNTVPAIIEQLGGPGGIVISESEFDNLFVLRVPSAGGAALVRLRYGDAGPAGVQARVIRFQRSGGIAGIIASGRIEVGSEGARVTAGNGYSRAIPANVAARLLQAVEAWPEGEPRTRSADRYRFEVAVDGGRVIAFDESATGELPAWIRKETAAIQRAGRKQRQ
jgi:broad specificity phosphatase PhoE